MVEGVMGVTAGITTIGGGGGVWARGDGGDGWCHCRLW